MNKGIGDREPLWPEDEAIEALRKIVEILRPFDEKMRLRVLRSVCVMLDIHLFDRDER